MLTRATRETLRRSKKGRAGRRNRLKAARSRGTLEKEKPPILGIIQRGGEVVAQMLANVKQATIKPLVLASVAAGALIHTDEYDICPPARMGIRSQDRLSR
jgi:transposase